MKIGVNGKEELAAGISRLEERREAAEAEAERAAERLSELNARRAALDPEALSNDRGGVEELGALATALDEESKLVSRTKVIAENAARELDRLVLEARVRYREEEKRLARKRFETLCRSRYSLDGEAEQAISDLIEVLDRLEGLHEDQIRAAADAEESYLVQQDPHGTIELWLARRLRRWLPNGSFEKYDAPLFELDPLAFVPEQHDGRQESVSPSP